MFSLFKPDFASYPSIPLVASYVEGGFPSPAEDSIEKELNLNELLIEHPAATFFIRVQGDSMQEAKIDSGDILIVDRSTPPSSGRIVVAVLNGEFTVKRLLVKEGRIFLKAENSKFPLIAINEETDFRIWGVVTYIIHKAK